MLRAVLDTNLIVSYLLTEGATISRIIDHWERGDFVYVVLPATVAELTEVLARPRLRRYMKGAPAILLDVIDHDAEHVPGEVRISGVCRDPKDDIFISCAVEGKADVIVSGDTDLLDLTQYGSIRIVSPHKFLELLAESQ